MGLFDKMFRQKDPSIIDQVSSFYAEHPTLLKTLGATVTDDRSFPDSKRQTGSRIG